MKDAPFNLAWGTSIYAKIDAINSYGISELSDAGNGAVIITYPEAPVDLTEVIAERTSTSITFSWSEGLDNGGTPVLDYRVSFDGAIGVYSVLATNLAAT